MPPVDHVHHIRHPKSGALIGCHDTHASRDLALPVLVQRDAAMREALPARWQAKIIGDLDADSLDTIEVVMTLEEEFGIEITDEIAESIRTVGDAIAAVTQLTSQKTKAA